MDKYNMIKNKAKGKLITFCGLDGCGKTSIINRLVSELGDNYSLFLTKQPTENFRKSDIFRTYMDTPNHEAYDYRSLSLLAAGDRIQHVNRVILPELEKGKIVISDRYVYSCLANLHARGYFKDKWIYEIMEYMLQPDISFFLDAPVDLALSRVRKREEEKDRYIDIDLQFSLRREYIDICKNAGGILISTDQPFNNTYIEVKDAVLKLLM